MDNKCDMCKADGKVESVTVTFRGSTAITDVCKKCAVTVQAIFEAGSTGPRKRARKVTKPQGHAVIPIA